MSWVGEGVCSGGVIVLVMPLFRYMIIPMSPGSDVGLASVDPYNIAQSLRVVSRIVVVLIVVGAAAPLVGRVV